jgi:hypothetical protein
MRAIGKADQHVHFGTQLCIVTAVGALGAPSKTTGLIDTDGCKEVDHPRDVATLQAELAGQQNKVVARVARLFTGILLGIGRSCRAAHEAIVGTGAVFDQRKHDPAHIGKQHATFAERRRPLHLGGIDKVQSLAGICGVPGDERDRRATLALIDTDRLAALQQRRPIPSAGDDLLVDHGASSDRRCRQMAALRQCLGRKFQPLLLVFLVAGAVGCYFFRRAAHMHHALSPDKVRSS